jgi:hypothetical protein
MVRKALGVLVPATIGALVASQWKEIARYLKIRQMSAGNGGPKASPPAGEFDSASRGGPASS